MAATPSSKGSSPKQVDGGASQRPESSKGGAASADAAPAAAAATLPPSSRLPTYESTAESEPYVAALALLKAGSLGEALEAVEDGLQEWTDLLERENAPDADLHESLAPWQYLYGTTLLYQIEEEEEEENSDNPGGGVVVPEAAAAAASGAAACPAPEDGGGEAEGDGNEGRGDDEEAVDEEAVDDKQIAWENLESARAILERLIQERGGGAAPQPLVGLNRLRADLAQVRLREGDLNRMNGQHAAAAADYEDSLACLRDNDCVGPYDRKVADLHYNLGQAYLLQAAEAAAGVAATTATSSLASAPSPSSLRGRGVHHLWQCSRALAGNAASALAILLGGACDADELLDKAERAVDRCKRTSEEEMDAEQCDREEEDPAVVGRKLQVLRDELARAASLPIGGDNDACGGGADDEAAATIHELLQLLVEIQETVDEAERAEKGLQEVTELKAEISAAAAGTATAAGPIPGGGAAMGVSAAFAGGGGGAGFGSAAAAASTAAAQPIAAKRKSKKRDADAADLPATAPHNAKKPPASSEL